MSDHSRRWIDRNLIAIGCWFLFVGLVFTVLEAVRSATSMSVILGFGKDAAVSFPALAVHMMTSVSEALVYNSVWMIAAGLLLRHWQVTIVGFEESNPEKLKVDGPDSENVVWVGKQYPNTFDARLAANALTSRLMPADQPAGRGERSEG